MRPRHKTNASIVKADPLYPVAYMRTYSVAHKRPRYEVELISKYGDADLRTFRKRRIAKKWMDRSVANVTYYAHFDTPDLLDQSKFHEMGYALPA